MVRLILCDTNTVVRCFPELNPYPTVCSVSAWLPRMQPWRLSSITGAFEPQLVKSRILQVINVKLPSCTRSLRVLCASTTVGVGRTSSPLTACFLTRGMPYTQCSLLWDVPNWSNNALPFVEDTDSDSRKRNHPWASHFAANGY